VDTFTEQKEITEVSGNHKIGRTNTSVETIYVSSQSDTMYLPSKICTHFPNIKKIDIYAKKLVEITKEIFDGCSKLETVYLRYLNFQNVSADLFSGVPTLQKVMIIDSKIENLPQDLFKNNPNLNFIKFDNNLLKIVDFELTQDQKSKLKTFSFLNNPCISKAYKSDDFRSPKLTSVIDEISTKCRNNSAPTPAPLEDSPNEQRIQILELKVEDLEEIRKGLLVQIQDGVKKVNDNLEISKMKVEIVNNKLTDFKTLVTTNLTDEVNNVKTKYQKLASDAKEISDKSDKMLKNLQETLDIRKEHQELRSDIDHNESLLIATFALQMVTVAFAVMITIYVKFFINLGGSGGKSSGIENIMYNGNH
jgi:hypothetical protein